MWKQVGNGVPFFLMTKELLNFWTAKPQYKSFWFAKRFSNSNV